MLTPVDEKEAQDWQKEAGKVEAWNDVTKLKLFQRACCLIPLLWKEIEVLRERLKIRG